MRQRSGPSGPVIVLPTYENTIANGLSGAAYPIDWSLGPSQSITLTDPTTVLSQTGLPTGETAELTLLVTQDPTGNRHVAFADAVVPAAGLTLSTAPGATDLLDLHWNGHVLFVTVRGIGFH